MSESEKIGLLKKKELAVILVFVGIVAVIGIFFAAPKFFSQNQDNVQNNFPPIQQNQENSDLDNEALDNQPGQANNGDSENPQSENTGEIDNSESQDGGTNGGSGSSGAADAEGEAEEEDTRSDLNCIDIEGKICAEGTTCSNPPFVTSDTDVCCYGECV